jgi:hypothetical protein
MTEIVKTSMLCKCTMKDGSRPIFIEGNVYDVEIKPFRKGSCGFSRYQYCWGKGEDTVKRQINPTHFDIIFCDRAEKRERLIDDILK